MNEEEIRNILELYQRNELDPIKKAEVKTRLESDPTWQELQRQLTTESQGIRLSQLQDLQSKLQNLEATEKKIENNESSKGDLLRSQTSISETNETNVLGNIENTPVINLESPPDSKIVQGIRYMSLKDELKKLQSQEQVKSNADQNKKKDATVRGGKIIRLRRNWWVAAAGFLVIVIGGYFLKENNKPKYVNQYLMDHFDEYVLHDKVRGTNPDDSFDRDKEIGYDLYVLQEFEEAIPYLERRWKRKRDTLALFYLGVSYMGIGDTQKSNSILNTKELTKYSTLKLKLNKL